MPITIIRPVENNPLKFSMNAEDALHNLFVKRNPGYLAAAEAFREGIRRSGVSPARGARGRARGLQRDAGEPASGRARRRSSSGGCAARLHARSARPRCGSGACIARSSRRSSAIPRRISSCCSAKSSRAPTTSNCRSSPPTRGRQRDERTWPAHDGILRCFSGARLRPPRGQRARAQRGCRARAARRSACGWWRMAWAATTPATWRAASIVTALRLTQPARAPSVLLDEVEDRLQRSEQQLYSASLDSGAGMSGSTMVVLLAFERHVLSIWAGDSRIYRSRGRQTRADHARSQRGAGDAIDGVIATAGGYARGSNVITRAVGGAQELFLDIELRELRDQRPLPVVQRRAVSGDLRSRHVASPGGNDPEAPVQGAHEAGARRARAGTTFPPIVVQFCGIMNEFRASAGCACCAAQTALVAASSERCARPGSASRSLAAAHGATDRSAVSRRARCPARAIARSCSHVRAFQQQSAAARRTLPATAYRPSAADGRFGCARILRISAAASGRCTGRVLRVSRLAVKPGARDHHRHHHGTLERSVALDRDRRAAAARPGSVVKDRFVLEEELGQGGMGIVFKARDLRKEEAQDRNPWVAIKC